MNTAEKDLYTLSYIMNTIRIIILILRHIYGLTHRIYTVIRKYIIMTLSTAAAMLSAKKTANALPMKL